MAISIAIPATTSRVIMSGVTGVMSGCMLATTHGATCQNLRDTWLGCMPDCYFQLSREKGHLTECQHNLATLFCYDSRTP